MKCHLIALALPALLGGCLLAPNAYYEPSCPEGELRQTLTACEVFGPAQNLVVAIDRSLDLVVSAEPFNYATDTRDYGATVSFVFLSDQAITIPNTDIVALIDGRDVPLAFIEDRAASSRNSIGPILPEETSYRRIRLQGQPVRSGVFSRITLLYGVPGEAPEAFSVTPPTVQVGARAFDAPEVTFKKKTNITSYSLNC